MKNIKVTIKNHFLINNEIKTKELLFNITNNDTLELGISFYLKINEINDDDIILTLKNDDINFERQFRLSNSNPKTEYQGAFTDFEFKITMYLEE